MKKLSILAAMMVVVAGVALASTLDVPFFIDSGTNTGVAGIIGVKEISGNDQVLTVIYTGISGTAPVNQTVTFALGANQSVRWQPVQSGNEGSGSAVANMRIDFTPSNTIPCTAGTVAPTADCQTGGGARILGTDELVGAYQQINFTRLSDMAYSL